jgi:hypothetical protein
MKYKISFWRLIITGVVLAITAQIINSIGASLTMPYYLLEEYFPVWSKLMMPAAGPPPMSFFIYALAFNFLVGILFALVYTVVRNALPIKQLWLKGAFYGFLVFIVGGVPGFLSLLLLINLPFGLVVFWAFENLFTDLINGVVTAWINK